jgi:hypothetical protein
MGLTRARCVADGAPTTALDASVRFEETLDPDPVVELHLNRPVLVSVFIASGADVKVVQTRVRHASAKTTLDTYGHLWQTPTTAHEPPPAW